MLSIIYASYNLKLLRELILYDVSPGYGCNHFAVYKWINEQ